MTNFSEKKEGAIRLRFAPSPTGRVHIGNLRTVIYSYFIAKQKGGKFIVRIEDTDQRRQIRDAGEKIFQALDWIGIKPDEGVVGVNNKGGFIERGNFGPYIQSKRLEIYKKYANQLLEEGKAYCCFCAQERLEELRRTQQQNKQAPMYDRRCRELSGKEAEQRIKKGEKFVVRMKVPDNQVIKFEDKVFGKISVDSSVIDDQVLLKSDGFPTYHLAVVVDDYLMKISHVTRGEDWLPSTPKHVLLYNYFGWQVPEFIHFPNVLGPDKRKLSKRQGDVSVSDFKEKGYLPDAMVNFLALLGWNPGKGSTQEIFSMEQLINKFNVKNIHKAGAVFDYRKLDWMNSYYIRKKSDTQLLKLCAPYFEKFCKNKKVKCKEEMFLKIVKIEKERIKKLSDIIENIDFYFTLPQYDKELLKWKDMSDNEVAESLRKARRLLLAISDEEFTVENLTQKLLDAAADEKGRLLWPLRVAFSGKDKSPSPFEIAWALGKEEALKRIDKALNKLSE